MTPEPDQRDATLWSIYADFLDTICKSVLYAVIAAALAAIVAIVLGLGPVVFALAMLAGLLGFLWPFNASARAARKRVEARSA